MLIDMVVDSPKARENTRPLPIEMADDIDMFRAGRTPNRFCRLWGNFGPSLGFPSPVVWVMRLLRGGRLYYRSAGTSMLFGSCRMGSIGSKTLEANGHT
ncbi:hypothetical protein [Acetobacter sp.]|uniref:hypothetical protein n=1 Tax=Acetobacter sp. TaxID=440 RepID=UPI0039E74BCF